MTAKKAYKILKDTPIRAKGNHTEYSKALHLAMAALEKQIPKKPIKNGIGGYICPHCQGVILDLPHEIYHRDCGGRLE